MAASTTLICVFLTRGHPDIEGQGEELLSLRTSGGGSSSDELEFVLVDKVAGPTARSTGKDGKVEDPALQAAQRLISSNCFLDAEKDLRLVRRSKRVPWGGSADYIISFLFRMSVSYERGLEYSWSQAEAEQAGLGDQWMAHFDHEEHEQVMIDLTMYRLVTSKLGGPLGHRWETWQGLDVRNKAMTVEFISTAFYLVVLPPSLDSALITFSSVKPPIPADAAEQALNLFFKVVTSGVARKAFKFWSPAVPAPRSKDQELPSGVLKHRYYCYWLDVVAYQLRTCNRLLETTISAAFLRVLNALHLLVNDLKLSLDDFEKRAAKEIGVELARSRYATGVLEKLALGKILEQHPARNEALRKRSRLHIITLGHSPLVFGVLSGLVHYLLTTPAHPYSTLHPGIGALTREQQTEWVNKPEDCRITICETRPSCSGVVLAERLLSVVENSASRAKELRAMSRPGGPQGLAPALGERMRLQKEDARVLYGGNEEGSEISSVDALTLLDSVDSPNPTCKVTIESIPDGGIVQALRTTSPSSIIVLIPAEQILPDTADTLAPLGSFMLAWCGHEVKAKVFVITTTELIAASVPLEVPQGNPAELTAGWRESSAPKMAIGDEAMDRFTSKAADPKVTTLQATHQSSELVLRQLIDAFITENGVLDAVGVRSLGRERARAARLIFGDEER